MTTLLHRAMQTAKTFTVLERIILKVYLIIVGVFLAKLFPVLASLHRAYYLALIVLAKLYFISKIGQTK